MGGEFDERKAGLGTSRGALLPELQRRRRRAARRRGMALLVLIGAGIAAYFYFWAGDPPTQAPALLTDADPVELDRLSAQPPPRDELPPAPEALPQKPQAAPLPDLDASDSWVREAVARLSGHLDLASWLVSDDLIRRFATAVDNVAEGKSPRKQLSFLAPEADFVVRRDGKTIAVDPISYARYDRLTEAFVSLDGGASGRLYRRLEPLIDQAYRELGYPEAHFSAALERAIDELLRTPVVDGPIELVTRVIGYGYREAQLEQLSAAQKLLLRTGPENQRKVQDKLRGFAAEIGLSIDPALSVASAGDE